MVAHRLTHVRHDPAHCLAPGLFRSLKRGERKKQKLDVTYIYGDGCRAEFSGPEPLGGDDLRVLQGLVAMSGPDGLVLRPEPETDAGQQLRRSLDLKGGALQQECTVVRGSYGELAREIGYANPNDTQSIKDCIERLWKVSVILRQGSKSRGFRILSDYASDDQQGGRLYIALNPAITEAVMGGGHYVRIAMEEVRALQTDPARLIHQRLCGWINEGKAGEVGIDVLCGYIWPDKTANPNTQKKRRRAARKAASELVSLLGWDVGENGGIFKIRRTQPIAIPHANGIPHPR